MTIRTGTGNWLSVAAAKKAYGAEYEDALADGRLVIGKPALQPGDSLLTDKEGRFFIETPESEPVGGPGTDVHYRMTQDDQRRRNLSTGDFREQALCGCGSGHATLVRKVQEVTCRRCLQLLSFKPSYLHLQG